MSTEEKQHASIAAQVAPMQPTEFKSWVGRRLRAVENVLDTLVEQVTEGNLEPLAGARIASCVTGSAFGYEEFHPRAGAPPAEQMIDADLLGSIGRTRELASSH